MKKVKSKRCNSEKSALSRECESGAGRAERSGKGDGIFKIT